MRVRREKYVMFSVFLIYDYRKQLKLNVILIEVINDQIELMLYFWLLKDKHKQTATR